MEELLKLNEVNQGVQAVKDLRKRNGGLQPQTKYRPSHIIRRFMWQKFLAIPNERIMAVVINIKNTKADVAILNSWEYHFQGYCCGIKLGDASPYIVTENPKSKIKTLWKERVA